MTVIVYKGGIMASDSRAYSGDATPIGTKCKIHRLKNGDILGVTTRKPGLAEAVVKWFNSGRDLDEVPGDNDFSALRVNPAGQVFYYNGSFLPAGPIEAPYFAIGSGEEYALGAFAMGADVYRAVGVACELDVWCAKPVFAIELKGKRGASVVE